jgi:tellurite methyltransferase
MIFVLWTDRVSITPEDIVTRRPVFACGIPFRDMTEGPEDFIVRFQDRLPRRAEVLDVGCGAGRHALFLARAGCSVIALDRSPRHLRALEAIATTEQLTLKAVQADVESMSLVPSQLDLIVNTLFLYRPLFAEYSRALRPGGLLFFRTFTSDHMDVLGNERPRRDFLLNPGELRTAFPSLRLDYYDESISGGRAMATLVASRAQTVTE